MHQLVFGFGSKTDVVLVEGDVSYNARRAGDGAQMLLYSESLLNEERVEGKPSNSKRQRASASDARGCTPQAGSAPSGSRWENPQPA